MSKSLFLIKYTNKDGCLFEENSYTLKSESITNDSIIRLIKEYCEPKELFEDSNQSTGIVVLKNKELTNVKSKLEKKLISISKVLTEDNLDHYLNDIKNISSIIEIIRFKVFKFNDDDGVVLTIG